MRWNEIIKEGRDAPLYHGTSPNAAVRIIAADQIDATVEHIVLPDREPGGYKRLRDAKYMAKGVSLSRLKPSSREFGSIIFVFDQSKLSHNFRIIPMDYWGNSPDPELAGLGRRQGRYNEAEEFLVGSLKPVSRYLLRIELDLASYTQLQLNQARMPRLGQPELADMYEPILTHPLLLVDGKDPASIPNIAAKPS